MFGRVKNTGTCLRNNSLQISQKSHESTPMIRGWLKKFFAIIFLWKPKLIYRILNHTRNLVAWSKKKLLKIDWNPIQSLRLTPAPQETQKPKKMLQKPLAPSQPQFIQITKESQSQGTEKQRWEIDPALIDTSKILREEISNSGPLDPRLRKPLTQVIEGPLHDNMRDFDLEEKTGLKESPREITNIF